MSSRNELFCKYSGCTFQAKSRLGKQNHETRCQFSHPNSRVTARKVLRRVALDDSDEDVQSPRIEINSDPNAIISAITSHDSPQLQLRESCKRMVPELESLREERIEEENGEYEQAAILISEIAHKAGKGKVNELLEVLSPGFNLQEFTDRFRDVDSCHRHVDEYVFRTLHGEGFTERKIDSATGLQYSVFSRNPNTVIRNQVAAASEGSCFFSPVEHFRDGKPLFTHLMTAPAGHNIYAAVRNAVMSSNKIEVLWKTKAENGSDSFVGVGQIYSDKSSVTLKARGFQFYPVHLVLLNLSEELRRKMITSGASIVGYLPVSFQLSEQSKDKLHKKLRKELLLSVHEAIKNIFGPLIKHAEEGIPCVDSEGVSRTCHLAVGAYCSDIPEAKDMTGVLHGSSTAATCFRCMALTSNMNTVTSAKKRTLADTMQLISDSQKLGEKAKKSIPSVRKKMREEAESLLKEASLAGIAPVLASFPFVGLCPELELFCMHLYETLHNLHLGVSKLIKQACANRLTDQELVITAMESGGQERTFSSVRARVLSGANEILRQLEREFPAKGLRISFGSDDKKGRYNGFFKNDGVVGMLEAKDYQALDMVFPFIGAYIDRFCDEVEASPTTSIFTKYSEIIMMVYRRHMEPGWNEEDLVDLRGRIIKFKVEAVEHYKPYQASGMGTLKFHLLDHLVDDIHRMGGVEALDAGLYEHSHAKVKRWYSRTSKRRRTAMAESMEMMKRSQAYEKKSTRNEKSRTLNKTVTLVRDGCYVSVTGLVMARRDLRRRRKEGTEVNLRIGISEKYAEGELVLNIGEDGSRALIKLIKERINHERHSKPVIQIVKSGFLAGGFVPDLSDFNQSLCEIRLRNPPRFLSQRIVASRNFAGSDGLRQDCVLIEAEDDDGNSVVWVAKVLALFRVHDTGENPSIDEKNVLNLAFLQYFETVHPRDEVDKKLNCICLKWARAPEDGSTMEPSSSLPGQEKPPCKWFDLQPVDVIRGTVHVVSTDYVLDKKQDEICWWKRFFYVNRFYYDARAKEV